MTSTNQRIVMRLVVHNEVMANLRKAYPSWTQESASKVALKQVEQYTDRQLERVYADIKVREGIAKQAQAQSALVAALKVITLDPEISTYLAAHDPMALKQAKDAIVNAERAS